jgi:predicted membrane channel-forming protein YqfA (hemolysin III family)
MAPQEIHLVALQRSVKDAPEVLKPYPTYAERESAFRSACAKQGVKRPIGAGSIMTSKCVDANRLETILNLITCIPYNMAAYHIPKWKDGRKDFKRELFSAALHGVGVAATVYHAVDTEKHPKLRNLARRYDYCSVAAGYLAFTHAHQKLPFTKQLVAASAALLPFQPLIVAGAHTLGTEVAVVRCALKDPSLRKNHLIHTISAAIAIACFKGENIYKENPYLHATWHVFGALAIHQANKICLATK